MSRKKTVVVSLLAGLFVIAGSLVVLAQVAGENVGRNVLRMARQKNAGETVTQADAETAAVESSAAAPKAEPVRAALPAQIAAPATAAVGADEMLALLPAECLLCVRINKLDTTLGAVDQYIAGISPIPVSLAMLAKMQIGKLLSDPMLTGVNSQGDFALFATPLPADPDAPAFMPQVALGMLVPVSSREFYKNYSDSEIPGSKYALIALEPTMAQSLAAVKKQMLSSSLARGLAADTLRQSKASPIWAYANIAGAMKAFGPILFAQIDQMSAMIPQNTQPGGEINAKMTGAYVDFIKTYATQLDSLSLVLDPRPDTLNAAITLSALPNTELAALLVRDPAMKPGYSLGGFLNGPAAVNVLAKVNRPLFARLNTSMMNLLAEAMADTMPAENLAKWSALAASSMDVTGDELAISFSIAPGMPPAALKQIVMIKNADAVLGMMQQGLAAANEMYKAMDMNAVLALKAGETYRQSQIYTLTFDMKLPPEADEQQQQIYEQMMGSGFNYRLAVTSKMMLMTSGPDADADIRKLIDQTAAASPPAPAEDLRTALAVVPNAASADFVASVNVPRLVSGMGAMMGAMPVPNAEAMAAMFSQMNVPTKSCVGLAGTIESGRATLQVVLPKQHLLELVMMAGAMQQAMQPAMAPGSF
ncbi:MAG: hypothetical protein IH624_11885 [Phycisphaerae bacterium]|nr:hypothetical protein [Phycisphaerae bacterium]